MKIAPRLRRKVIVAGVLFACAATPSFAIFGLGDIVFDPTNYAELIAQATTAYNQYKARCRCGSLISSRASRSSLLSL